MQKKFEIIKEIDIGNINHILIEILHFLSAIASNHHRDYDFFKKIEKIIIHFSSHLQTITNHQLYNIFKNNQVILHFLFKEKLLTLDQQQFISFLLNNRKSIFLSYFFPEIKEFVPDEYLSGLNATKKIYDEDPELFEKNREIGENTDKIAQLIRTDSVEKFIQFTNQINFNLNSKINPSIYETNDFLVSKQLTLIEYATFHGSTQIIKYLHNQNTIVRIH